MPGPKSKDAAEPGWRCRPAHYLPEAIVNLMRFYPPAVLNNSSSHAEDHAAIEFFWIDESTVDIHVGTSLYGIWLRRLVESWEMHEQMYELRNGPYSTEH